MYLQTFWVDVDFASQLILIEENNIIDIGDGLEFNKGLWINYLPMNNQNEACKEINDGDISVKYLIYSLLKSQWADDVLLAFLELNLQDNTISFNIYIKNKNPNPDELQWQYYQFNINIYTIDGDWILFYYYIKNGQIKLYLYSFNQNDFQIKEVTWNGDFTYVMYDYTGGLNVIEIDNNFLNFNIFPGKISKVFQTDINFFDNLNSFLENCNAVFICNTETIEILTSIIKNNNLNLNDKNNHIEYFNGDHIVDGVSYGNQMIKQI